jgi:hypothetical protein
VSDLNTGMDTVVAALFNILTKKRPFFTLVYKYCQGCWLEKGYKVIAIGEIFRMKFWPGFQFLGCHNPIDGKKEQN